MGHRYRYTRVYRKKTWSCEVCPFKGSQECNSGDESTKPCASFPEGANITMDGKVITEGNGYDIATKYYKERAKMASKSRKQYAHLDKRYKLFQEWIPSLQCGLTITRRAKEFVFIRRENKKKADMQYNLEKNKFFCDRINSEDLILLTEDFKAYCEENKDRL